LKAHAESGQRDDAKRRVKDCFGSEWHFHRAGIHFIRNTPHRQSISFYKESRGIFSPLRYNSAMGEAETKKGPGAPRHGDQVKKVQAFACEPDLWKRAMEIAKTRGESLSGILQRALRRYVKKHGGE
jgi:hypothetical protein